MINAKFENTARLLVSTGPRSGPYLIVPVARVDAVRQILDLAGIPFWVDETSISLDGKPALTVVNFGKSVNPDLVQSALDGCPSPALPPLF